MRVLLINPSFDYYYSDLMIREPLSLGYLAAYLIKFGHEVAILDAIAGKVTKKGTGWHYGLKNHEITQKIREINPDLVGVTCPFSLRADAALHVTKLVKRINKNIIVVVGGIHPTIFPLETASHKEVDYVIIGEGEESLLKLIKHIESGRKYPGQGVDGCAYKRNRKVVLNPKTKFTQNLDDLPFPTRNLLPMKHYLHKETVWFSLGRKAASIITSRSCPMRCTFCCMYLSHGPILRARSAGNVYREIEEIVNKYQAKEIFIIDDNFTFNKNRVIALCRLIINGGLKFRWSTPNGIRADKLDLKLATMMKKAGCVHTCIGIEAGNDWVRNEIVNKNLSRKQIEKALQICKKVGLPVIGFFILGLPGETEKTFKDTIKMVKELPFSMIATSFYIPLPGTKLYNVCIQQGYLKKDYWKKIKRFNSPILETPDFDIKTLRRWEKTIYYEFIKSHFWSILWSTLTFRNKFFKTGLIKRFLIEKFGISI